MKNYKVIEDGTRYTIGEYDSSYKAYITNDGICNYYFWDSKEEAEAAAEAYNTYEGEEWLGQHGYGNDRISEEDEAYNSYSEEMIQLYRLFNAVD